MSYEKIPYKVGKKKTGIAEMSSVGGRGRWAQGNRKSVPQELAPPVTGQMLSLYIRIPGYIFKPLPKTPSPSSF